MSQSIIGFPICLDSHVMLLYPNASIFDICRPEDGLLPSFDQMTQTSVPEWRLQIHPRDP